VLGGRHPVGSVREQEFEVGPVLGRWQGVGSVGTGEAEAVWVLGGGQCRGVSVWQRKGVRQAGH